MACYEKAKDKTANDKANEPTSLIDRNDTSNPATKSEKIVVNEIDTTIINVNESEIVSFADSSQSNNSSINCDATYASIDGIEFDSTVTGITVSSFISKVSTLHVVDGDDDEKGYDADGKQALFR